MSNKEKLKECVSQLKSIARYLNISGDYLKGRDVLTVANRISTIVKASEE